MEDKVKELENELYSTRILIFLEREPQSNRYNQIMLDSEEFKKMSMTLGRVVGKQENGLDKVELFFSEEEYTLPDLKQIYK